jgi:hypothetical protein
MNDCALARASWLPSHVEGPKHLRCQPEAPASGQNDTWTPPLADSVENSGDDRPTRGACCVVGYDGLVGTFLMACWYSVIRRRIR